VNPCGTQAPNDVIVLAVDPATGLATGAETVLATNATLPSFSPDGEYVAFVRGGALVVQKVDPVTGAADGAPVTHPAPSPTIATGLGDDSRPRWQPRP
jgi:hypothetical protein